MLADRQISSEWLRAPNEQDRSSLLEYTRGVLYGLSFVADGPGYRVRPVHVSRVRNAFNDLGAPSLHRVGLKLLALLGEVEALFGGYWLTTPFRVLNIESKFAFVGAVPSVSDSLALTGKQGLARYLSEESAAKFPVQSLEGWMGETFSSHQNHLQDFIKTHQEYSAPALNSPENEYLTLISKGSLAKRTAWSREPSAILPREQLAICRQADRGIYRYFSAELAGDMTISNEATLRHSIQRLTFAFAYDAGTPFRVVTESVGPMLEVEVPQRLPTEEFRLSLLLARAVARQGAATRYSIESDLAPVFLSKLRNLGCHLESSS